MNNLLPTVLAILGLASTFSAHGVSRRSHLLQIFTLEDRNWLVNTIALAAMWASPIATLAWFFIFKTWWVTILLIFLAAILSNFLLFIVPSDQKSGIPLGKMSLLATSELAIAGAVGAYYFSYQGF